MLPALVIVKIVGITLAALSGVGLLVVAGVVPGAIDNMLRTTIGDMATHPKVSDLEVAPKRGVSFNGTSADNDDTATVTSFYLNNITNLEAFLAGARPVLAQVGPIRMREYIQWVNVSISDDKRFKTFKPWSNIIADPGNDPALLDTPVVIPNPAFFQAKATIQGASPVLMGMGRAFQFEDWAIPALASNALATVGGQIALAIDASYIPVTISSRMTAALSSAAYSGNTSALIEDWRLSSAGAPDAVMVLPSPATVGIPTAGFVPITASVAVQVLTNLSSPICILNPSALALYLAAATNSVPIATAWTTAYPAEYASAPALLAAHLTQVGGWLAAWTTAGTPHNTAGHSVIVTTLTGLGVLPAGSTSADFPLVVAAQLGSNAALGALLTISAPAVFPAAKTSLSGSANACPTFASLADNPAAAAQLLGPPELSCYSIRDAPAMPRLVPFSRLRTRLTATQMAVLYNELSNATTGMTTSIALALTLRGALADATTLSAVTALSAQLALLHDAYDAAADKAGADANTTAFLQSVPAATVSSNLQAGLAASAAAAPGLNRLVALNLNVFQWLDILNWMNMVARDVAYRTLVRTNPTTNVASATGLFAGPFIRVTPREFFFSGYVDGMLRAQGIPLVPAPGWPTRSQPTLSAFLASSAATVYTVYTGADNTANAQRLYSIGGNTTLYGWGEPTPVDGSYDSRQFPPTLDRRASFGSASPSLLSWNSVAERPVYLTKDREVFDPSGTVKLWRYSLFNMSVSATGAPVFAIARYSTGRAHGTPRCLIYASYASSPPGHFYVGTPYGNQCDDEATSQMASLDGSVPAVSEQHYGSFVDLEPISGFTFNARRRFAMYVRVAPSAWYPTVPAGPLGNGTFIQLMWAEEAGAISAEGARAYQSNLDFANKMADQVIPGVGIGLGIALLLLAAALVYTMTSTGSRKVQPHDGAAQPGAGDAADGSPSPLDGAAARYAVTSAEDTHLLQSPQPNAGAVSSPSDIPVKPGEATAV